MIIDSWFKPWKILIFAHFFYHNFTTVVSTEVTVIFEFRGTFLTRFIGFFVQSCFIFGENAQSLQKYGPGVLYPLKTTLSIPQYPKFELHGWWSHYTGQRLVKQHVCTRSCKNSVSFPLTWPEQQTSLVQLSSTHWCHWIKFNWLNVGSVGPSLLTCSVIQKAYNNESTAKPLPREAKD